MDWPDKKWQTLKVALDNLNKSELLVLDYFNYIFAITTYPDLT